MALDAHYILAFTFEKYFVDKDTGLPLSNGYINFFRDSSRSTPKDVYIISGSPPNYTYLPIGSTVNLTSYGVPVYSNNNIAIYFLPYTLDNNNDPTDIVDLYYYEVYSEDDVLQFTREGQPNVFQESSEATANNNYVPNGQFWWHNDIPAAEVNEYVEGQVTENSTVVAPGGWSFDRTTGTNVVDIVTFERIDSVSSINPEDDPRYQIRINCQDSTGGGSYKDLRLKFDSVNKFMGDTEYSYTFSVENNEVTTIENVQLVLIKNYGTGGSPQTETIIGTFNITAALNQLSFTFSFGKNIGKTLSATANDDYLQLAIRLPADEEFDVLFTNFGLFSGDFSSTTNIFTGTFAATTDNQMTYQALAGSIVVNDYFDTNAIDPTLKVKNPNLYLPLLLKETGLDFDRSVIGKVEQSSYYNTSDWDVNQVSTYTNLIIAAGQQFATADYSPLNIPYSRLQSKYWNTTFNLPIYGTGPEFMTVTIPAADKIMLVSNNSEGAVTNATAETSGFTIATIHKETATYYMLGYQFGSVGDAFDIENINVGAVTNPINPHTSGFTVSVEQTGNTFLNEISSVVTVAASMLTDPGNPGKYFTVDSINNVPANLGWYVWYQITTETDPAPVGRTGIKINLIATDTAQTVAQKTWQAINGWQETTIQTVAAGSITGGDYFKIFANPSKLYVVWYEVNGAGTQPVVADATFIKVVLTGSETDAQVATKTQIAMNMKYFAVPDFRGWFLRGWNDGANVDENAFQRKSFVPLINVSTGDVLGTFELDTNKSHAHFGEAEFVSAGGAGADVTLEGGAYQLLAMTQYDGSYETQPRNKNVLFAIRY